MIWRKLIDPGNQMPYCVCIIRLVTSVPRVGLPLCSRYRYWRCVRRETQQTRGHGQRCFIRVRARGQLRHYFCDGRRGRDGMAGGRGARGFRVGGSSALITWHCHHHIDIEASGTINLVTKPLGSGPCPCLCLPEYEKCRTVPPVITIPYPLPRSIIGPCEATIYLYPRPRENTQDVLLDRAE